MIPTEVVPEYQADVGVKSHERVDYALLREGHPIILIEAKQVDVKLDDKKHLTQLFRYWNATPAKVGILTNGIEYRFYGDTDQDNLMDESPFLTINITKMSPRDVASVSAFSKYNYNLEDTAKLSEELFYQDAIRKVMIEVCKEPKTPFVRWMMSRTYDGMRTAAKIEWFKDQIKIALKDFGFATHQSVQVQEEVSTTNDSMDNQPAKPINTTEEWTSLEDYEWKSGVRRPQVIRLPDGTESGMRSWYGLIVGVAEYLANSGSLTHENCPIYAGNSGKAWVNAEPRHPDGKPFPRYHKLSNGLFLYTNVSAKNAILIGNKLLEHCGQDTSQVWLKTG